MGADGDLRTLVAAFRRAGWLRSLGSSDDEAMAAVVAAISPQWGCPPAFGLEEALLLADSDRSGQAHGPT